MMAATVVFTVAACSDEDEGFVLGGGGSSEPVKPSTEVTSRLEVPALKSGNQLITHWTTEKGEKVMDYCLEYDYDKYHSRWVAFRFDGMTSAKYVGRKSYQVKPQYPKDPLLTHHYIEDDRSFNGYQHGHLCASADRLYSRDANDMTFYMSNMSPMIGDFNAGYWTQFESFVQGKGRDRSFADTLYVVKGGTIADGQFGRRVANNRIVVPKYYFMAVLKVKNKVYSSIGFWMEHKDYGYDYDHQAPRSVLKEKAVSIDRLEELTGIDFFHNLPDKVEEQVEKTFVPSAWGIK